MTVMHEAVDERARHDVVAEDVAPVLEAFVAREHGGRPLVAAAHELEEEHGPGPREREVAELVDDERSGEDQFLGELRWFGIRPSPSYVGEPECNGVMEHWIRTLKENCLYLHDFATLDEARQVIGEFIERYNRQWVLERHGYRTPTEVRASLTRQAA